MSSNFQTLNTVERRFKRRQYKRKVGLREYFRATDHFYYAVKRQFRRKNLATDFLFNRRSTVFHIFDRVIT